MNSKKIVLPVALLLLTVVGGYKLSTLKSVKRYLNHSGNSSRGIASEDDPEQVPQEGSTNDAVEDSVESNSATNAQDSVQIDRDSDVAMTYSELERRISAAHVLNLDAVPGILPFSFLANFTIKHGGMIVTAKDAAGHPTASTGPVVGPRGHLAEPDVPGIGMHTEPLAPRAFVFDPNTGFVISYNGGVDSHGQAQQGGNDLDTMSFNFSTNSFELKKITFPLSTVGQVPTSTQHCTKCHGENNRPIFSMYPDWPRFYGSDNDELLLESNSSGPAEVASVTRLRQRNQRQEHEDFLAFKQRITSANLSRYLPLFDQRSIANHSTPQLAFTNYETYPYRSDVENPGAELDSAALSKLSRSFTRRAGLRFNLMTSRLLVKQVMDEIKSHPHFNQFGSLFTYNIMRCGVETNAGNLTKQKAVVNAWKDRVVAALRRIEQGRKIEYKVWNSNSTDNESRLTNEGFYQVPAAVNEVFVADGRLLQYGHNLALFDLKINDVDMRFTYYHEAYLPENAFKEMCAGKPATDQCADKVMQVGYLQNWYFNSYNDGSTTMDEHLTAELLTELAKSNPQLLAFLRNPANRTIRGLLDKYSSATYVERMKYDRPFFTKMDEYSKWFSLPYPRVGGADVSRANQSSFQNLHHRAPFNEAYRVSHEGVCRILETKLLTPGP